MPENLQKKPQNNSYEADSIKVLKIEKQLKFRQFLEDAKRDEN